MVNNFTNINKNHLSLQLIEWRQQFHQYQQKSPLTSIHWVMVNNSTNINKNHLSPQLIGWWSTIPPISTSITSHLNSLNDGQQFHQYQQKSPLTLTLTNINKNHLSLQLIEWWSTIPPISTKITSHQYQPKSLSFIEWCQQFHQYQQKSTLSDGQQFHQYQQKSPLTLTHWWSTISPISTKITSHLNSLSDGQQFHQYQQKSPLTSTHWVMVNNSTNINKNHLSPQLIEWWSTIPPISTKITSHLNSLSDGQQFHQYQQKSPLTSTHWVMVNNSTNINKNHLSPSTHWVMVNNSTNINKNHLSHQLIEWCQQFHQYQQKSPLISTHWMMVNNSTTKIKNHLNKNHPHLNSLSDGSTSQFTNINNSTNINKKSPLTYQLIDWCQQWSLIEWWSTIPPISTKITSLNSLNDHWYQPKSHLTLSDSTQLSTIPPILTKITSHINSLSDVNNSTNINKIITSTHWVMSIITPISTKITSHFNSLNDGQQFHQYQQKSPLTSTHWVMVNNSTNINKNHLSPQLIEWWSTIPPISTKITSHFNSLSDVNNSTNINKNHLSPLYIEWWSTIPPISTKITSHLNSLGDGQQFHQYQQTSPLTLTHWMMVNNSTNINKNHLSP